MYLYMQILNLLNLKNNKYHKKWEIQIPQCFVLLFLKYLFNISFYVHFWLYTYLMTSYDNNFNIYQQWE